MRSSALFRISRGSSSRRASQLVCFALLVLSSWTSSTTTVLAQDDAPSGTPTTEAQNVFNGVFPTQMAEEEATEGEPGGDEGDSSSGGGGDESIANLDEFLGDDLAFAGNELQDPVAHLWLYHGILMGVAWGLFAPVAIFIPLLRKLDFMEYDDRWKSIHFLSSLTVVVLTVAGFALAVMAANPFYSIIVEEKGKSYSYFTGNMHVAMGVMILVIMIMQAVMGCCIPGERIDDDDDDDDSSWDSGMDSESGDDKEKGNDDAKSKKSSSPLHTMMIDNKIVNDDGQLVPNRTAYKQYLPKRLAPTVQERARKRAEATTILGSATGTGFEHQVASLTPRKTEAKSHRLEAIEVVDVPDLHFVSKMNQESDQNDAEVPTSLTPIETDEVSALEDPAPPMEPAETLPEKSDFLICWIYTHRLLGLALFAMALYTCHTGLVLQSEMMSDDSEDTTAPTYWTKEVTLSLFWGVPCGIIALMLLVRCAYPCLQNSCRTYRELDRPSSKSDKFPTSSDTDSKGSSRSRK